MIALRGGGTLETVIDGVTGRFWSGGVDGLVDAVTSFDDAGVDPRACVENAQRFRIERFCLGLAREVDSAYARARGGGADHERRPARNGSGRRLGLGRRPA